MTFLLNVLDELRRRAPVRANSVLGFGMQAGFPSIGMQSSACQDRRREVRFPGGIRPADMARKCRG